MLQSPGPTQTLCTIKVVHVVAQCDPIEPKLLTIFCTGNEPVKREAFKVTVSCVKMGTLGFVWDIADPSPRDPLVPIFTVNWGPSHENGDPHF
jgi:hypothetical protein